MKLVIDIPEELYKNVVERTKMGCVGSDVWIAVANGTPLPKGHGELIDKDVVLDMMNHGILEEYITVMGGIIPADK